MYLIFNGIFVNNKIGRSQEDWTIKPVVSYFYCFDMLVMIKVKLTNIEFSVMGE